MPRIPSFRQQTVATGGKSALQDPRAATRRAQEVAEAARGVGTLAGEAGRIKNEFDRAKKEVKDKQDVAVARREIERARSTAISDTERQGLDDGSDYNELYKKNYAGHRKGIMARAQKFSPEARGAVQNLLDDNEVDGEVKVNRKSTTKFLQNRTVRYNQIVDGIAQKAMENIGTLDLALEEVDELIENNPDFKGREKSTSIDLKRVVVEKALVNVMANSDSLEEVQFAKDQLFKKQSKLFTSGQMLNFSNSFNAASNRIMAAKSATSKEIEKADEERDKETRAVNSKTLLIGLNDALKNKNMEQVRDIESTFNTYMESEDLPSKGNLSATRVKARLSEVEKSLSDDMLRNISSETEDFNSISDFNNLIADVATRNTLALEDRQTAIEHIEAERGSFQKTGTPFAGLKKDAMTILKSETVDESAKYFRELTPSAKGKLLRKKSDVLAFYRTRLQETDVNPTVAMEMALLDYARKDKPNLVGLAKPEEQQSYEDFIGSAGANLKSRIKKIKIDAFREFSQSDRGGTARGELEQRITEYQEEMINFTLRKQKLYRLRMGGNIQTNSEKNASQGADQLDLVNQPGVSSD